MKNKILVSSITLALAVISTGANADFPRVTIDSDVILNYDKTIDLTGAISVPNPKIDTEADISINQFNHDSPVSATGSVVNNNPMGDADNTITDLEVNVTAVGNNASVEIDTDGLTVGSVQGNQNGGASATGVIANNRIDLGDEDLVELNVTAVGNNATIEPLEDSNVSGVTLGSLQFNYDSPVKATGSISNNGFGVAPVPRDPKLAVTAVGNNLSSINGTTGSLTQINRNSPVSSTGVIANNVGAIGPVQLDVTAVGNNISIKAPSLDD